MTTRAEPRGRPPDGAGPQDLKQLVRTVPYDVALPELLLGPPGGPAPRAQAPLPPAVQPCCVESFDREQRGPAAGPRCAVGHLRPARDRVDRKRGLTRPQ
ncbi:hypothetical protein [Streptomyces sp. NPDC000851]